MHFVSFRQPTSLGSCCGILVEGDVRF
jgi:hypothetical protein